MTLEELEVVVNSLKQQLHTIAERTLDRDSKTETNVSEVSTKTNTIAAIDGATFNPNKRYKEGDLVVYNSSIARCKFACIGVAPSNSTYWELKSIAEALVEIELKIDALSSSSTK